MTSILYHPLTLGEIFELSLRIYRARFWPLFLLFFAANGATYLVMKLPQALLMNPAMVSQKPEAFVGAMAFFYAAALAAGCLYFLAINVLMAFVTLQVEHLYAGQLLSGTVAFQRLKAVVFPLLLTVILSGLLTGMGFILCVVPGLILLVRFSFAVPVFLMEDFRYTDALWRSWRLTGFRLGNDWTSAVLWRVSAVLLVGMALGFVVSMLFQMPFMLAAMAQGIWSLGKGQAPGALGPMGGGFLFWSTLGEVAGMMGKAVIQPYLVISMVTLYLDTRGRKDGLGIIFRARALREVKS